MKRHRFFNMYLTTTISVALVLFLVGMECIVILSAHNLITRIKENIVVTAILVSDVDSTDVQRMGKMLEVAPYCIDSKFVSREEALAEHIEHLGEDPTKFLGYNPLSDSYEINLVEHYACDDSIKAVVSKLSSLPYVEDVMYQEDIVRILDSNLGDVYMIFLIIGAGLLLMALALIVNTIRLHIYSKRFIINTMRLVGATPWVIKVPFIRRNVLMGVEAGLLSLVVLAGVIYYCKFRLGIMLFELTAQNICFIAVSVLAAGIVITFFASLFATGKYVRMKVDKMYEI